MRCSLNLYLRSAHEKPQQQIDLTLLQTLGNSGDFLCWVIEEAHHLSHVRFLKVEPFLETNWYKKESENSIIEDPLFFFFWFRFSFTTAGLGMANCQSSAKKCHFLRFQGFFYSAELDVVFFFFRHTCIWLMY